MMKALKNLSRKQIIVLSVVLVLINGAVVFFVVRNAQQSKVVDSGPNYGSTQITRGSFNIDIEGYGTLIAADTVEVGFMNEGVIASIDVEPGDIVSEGDVLAELADLDELQAEVNTLQIAANQATENYQYALDHPEVALAEAQATLAAANLAVEEAQKDLHYTGEGRCSDDTIMEYYWDMRTYEDQAHVWQTYLDDGGSGYGRDFILKNLNPILEKYRLAYINWQYCQGYTSAEITDSEMTLDMAKAEQTYAQTIVDKINSTKGIDEDTLAILEAEATLAQLKLELAQIQLEGSVIFAPCDGLITVVNAKVDDDAEIAEIITIARDSIPVAQFIIDESDYTYVTAGVTGTVEFDALPDKVFTGYVSRVDLGMDSTFGFASIQGQFTLDNSPYFDNVSLPYGMMGTITMNVKNVQNAILVPTGAVLSDTNGDPYVYMLVNNVPQKQTIEVGVQGDSYFEVLSGLQEGDLVATSFDDIDETY
jgi:RND family efflux transporter MFP subunit